MVNVFFVHQIKRTNGVFDKGVVVKDLPEIPGESDAERSTRNKAAALQAYHAYLGAYAYGHDETTDFVSCEITDLAGARVEFETWMK